LTCPKNRRDERFGVVSVVGDSAGTLIYSDETLQVGMEKSSVRQLEYKDFVKNEFALSSGRLGSDGLRIRESMSWPSNRYDDFPRFNPFSEKVADKRLEAHRKKTHRRIGQVHDPIADTMAHLSANHVFGRTYPADEYGVAQLVQPRIKEQGRLNNMTLTGKVNNKAFEFAQPHKEVGVDTLEANVGELITPLKVCQCNISC
jgi:hypothetical protein